jgi:sulfur carrier protein
MIRIVINGQDREVPDDESLARVVASIATSATGIAVAVNGEVVRRASWPSVLLAAGDEIEVLTAVQGG